jgi:hypothetical protein
MKNYQCKKCGTVLQSERTPSSLNCPSMRWFWGSTGFPQSHGWAAWMVITPKLADAILSKFLINPAERSQIDKFLAGEIKGGAL